ncbi:hypothetical protein LTR10_016601 [Elasticomyces elasticus]|uniref:Uncharacterized protein n=1 Tax=Exophiala sideris TaxID=1016849 RepID=A0ABR0JJK9_9EURO|nr:hypothetical protein LTR10_016601 [Elasticomyces elasticus]KAK5035246.1 hypothetical protein LTS07_002682 [Exophiala sideris]KAK5039402.1 hypothetical protein LTR13_003659 [Exophiala sideris]KAK5066170.1 hypothetical protein LTR69_002688 [Exophiala sideris]KAK5186847.1 hypothetical protein LTR44_000853 [Eurotiomycetes sp. CCFEE 6388]
MTTLAAPVKETDFTSSRNSTSSTTSANAQPPSTQVTKFSTVQTATAFDPDRPMTVTMTPGLAINRVLHPLYEQVTSTSTSQIAPASDHDGSTIPTEIVTMTSDRSLHPLPGCLLTTHTRRTIHTPQVPPPAYLFNTYRLRTVHTVQLLVLDRILDNHGILNQQIHLRRTITRWERTWKPASHDLWDEAVPNLTYGRGFSPEHELTTNGVWTDNNGQRAATHMKTTPTLLTDEQARLSGVQETGAREMRLNCGTTSGGNRTIEQGQKLRSFFIYHCERIVFVK